MNWGASSATHAQELRQAQHHTGLRGWQITLIALVLGLTWLGLRGIFDPDEGRYSNVAINMLDSGNWWMPMRTTGVGHWTKPPLTYWAIATSFMVFGVNAFAARVPSLLAYLGGVFLMRQLGLRLVPARANEAAFLYATMLLPVGASQLVTTDGLLALAETLAVTGFVCARFGTPSVRAARAWGLAMWAGFGLGFLIKGPPALLPALALMGFVWVARGRMATPHRVHWGWTLLGLLLFACIALPWYVLVTTRVPGLLHYFTGTEVVARVASDVHRRNGQWYGWLLVYSPTLLLGCMPWTADVLRWVRRWPDVWRTRNANHSALQPSPWPDVLLIFWVVLPLAVFCISRSRLPLYVLPLFAPLALGAARARDWRGAGFTRFGKALGLAIAIAVAGAVAFTAPRLGWAHYQVGDDAQPLAVRITRMAGPVKRVLFVDDTPRYGLHVYLGAPARIERVTLHPAPQPAIGPEYDHTAAAVLPQVRHDPRVVWVAPAAQQPAITQWAHAQGASLHVLGALEGERVLFRLQ